MVYLDDLFCGYCFTVMCREDEFQCPSSGSLGNCHPMNYLCDGFEDCEDGYDENNCTTGVLEVMQNLCNVLY